MKSPNTSPASENRSAKSVVPVSNGLDLDSSGTQVLFIGGSGRSGSTILEVLLGQVEGVFPVGEVRYLWSKGFGQDRLCGCGQSFSECEFWVAVTSRAFGSLSEPTLSRLRGLEGDLYHKRRLPGLLKGSPSVVGLSEYLDLMSALYRSIVSVSGCRVIVDSSKIPNHAALLHRIPDIDLNIVHLVRDSRAVAWSWQRKKRMTNVHWKESYMGQYGRFEAARGWMYMNLATHLVRLYERAGCFLRYEDFVADPLHGTNAILDLVGIERQGDGFLERVAHSVTPNHGLAGNPARFTTGGIRLEADDEWLARMPWVGKTIVTVLCLPLLASYGYFPKRSVRSGAVGDSFA